jgi:magnesium-transporting ATPase (P-type)
VFTAVNVAQKCGIISPSSGEVYLCDCVKKRENASPRRWTEGGEDDVTPASQTVAYTLMSANFVNVKLSFNEVLGSKTDLNDMKDSTTFLKDAAKEVAVTGKAFSFLLENDLPQLREVIMNTFSWLLFI